MTYEPSAAATNEPLQTGGPSQVILSGDGYGPCSVASTVTGSPPRPVTATVSVTAAPGSTAGALTCVLTVGCASTLTSSDASPQGVVSPTTSSLPGITSW